MLGRVADVTNELQNVMLQHANINTFVRHYSVGIHVNAQAIVRGLPQEKRLMRFSSSMSRSIDPRRPYKPTEEDIRASREWGKAKGAKESGMDPLRIRSITAFTVWAAYQ